MSNKELKNSKRIRNLQVFLGTSSIFVSGLSLYAYQNISKAPLNIVLTYTAGILAALNCYQAYEEDLKIQENKNK